MRISMKKHEEYSYEDNTIGVSMNSIIRIPIKRERRDAREGRIMVQNIEKNAAQSCFISAFCTYRIKTALGSGIL
jgi:hypothetical protein